MNKYFKSAWQLFTLASVLSVGISCSDTWDDHYNNSNSSVSNANSIASYLSQIDGTSNFIEVLKNTKMLKINDEPLNTTFYDFLSSDQFVTLWVPLNGSIDSTEWEIYMKPNKTNEENEYTAKRFVMNYLARYNHTLLETSDSVDVLMMNKKHHILFSNKRIDEAIYLLDAWGNPEVNISCSNGIIHLLNGTLSYKPTIYEFLTTDERYKPLIGDFLEKYVVSYLDENKSVPSGIDDEGNMVYIDSVMTESNLLLSGTSDYLPSGLGLINSEDSSYIMVLPSPEGWAKQYNDMYDNFDYGVQDSNNDSIRILWSNTAMIRDAIFNKNLQRSPIDSVCSTLYSFSSIKTKDNIDFHRFKEPFDPDKGLFYKGIKDSIICSNGIIYITDDWNFDKYQVYMNKIVEDCYYYDDQECFTSAPVDSANNGVNIENEPNRLARDGYVLRIGSIGTTDPFLKWTFYYMIHDVVAGDYKLSLVFARDLNDNDYKPISIHPSVYYYYDSDPTKRVPGSYNEKKLVDSIGSRNRPHVYRGSSEPKNLDTIQVVNIVKVPYCSYGIKNASLQIRLQNYINSTEINKYSPYPLLESIILEPIKE